MVISSTNISSHTSKPYVPQGEIICSQQDASAFTGRVGFEVFYPWLIFHPFLCCRPVSELPGAYTKDAERVRESFLVSGGSPRPRGFCSVHRSPSRSHVVPRCSSPANCHQQRGLQDHFTETGGKPVSRDSEASVFR